MSCPSWQGLQGQKALQGVVRGRHFLMNGSLNRITVVIGSRTEIGEASGPKQERKRRKLS